jgi:hypothetical protein
LSDLEPINPLKDESNPTAVINLVPGVMAKGLKAIPEYVFDLSLEDLEAKATPTEALRKIRIAFWLEYERAHRCGTLVNMTNVYKGICSQSYFFKILITNSFKLAFILTPPQDYRVQMEEMLELAIRAERTVLETPIKQVRIITNKNGEQKSVEVTDSALAMVHHKIRESIQNRLQGMPVHRSMQINENRNFTSNAPTDGGSLADGFDQAQLNGMDAGALSDLVKELKAENSGQRQVTQGPEASQERDAQDVFTIDVTATTKDGA